MRRLFWIGVGVAVTVVVIRKGRQIAEEYLPAGTTDVVDGASRVTHAFTSARREFLAGMSERETELRAALVGDVDVEEVRANREQHVADLRDGLSRARAPRVPADWAGPLEDPDDDGEASFF
ncbi:hypothetical protein [Cellulomonas composti]|uniref:Uncharacterized protein n=1 Tax=Cellulomonas composti TaxID=266130 RepID=A0A511J7F5_9CELL|nr:hypothetical protein [Cellulomonas composti]GEL93643.1 hypothetical protein CCO02nite_03010 [Cellulomonas composti]